MNFLSGPFCRGTVFLLNEATIKGAEAAQSNHTASGTAIVHSVTTDRMIKAKPPIKLVYMNPIGPRKAASRNAERGDLTRFIAI